MKDRHAWPGLLLLGALAILLVSLLLWGDHFLTPSPAGGIGRLVLPRAASSSSGPHASALHDARRSRADRAVLGEAAAPFRRPGPSVPDEPSRSESGSAASVAPLRPVSPGVPSARYALELGTFAIDEDAERAEVQLNQAGFSTVRFTQETPLQLFTVAIKRLGTSKGTVEANAEDASVRADPDRLIPTQPFDSKDRGLVWIAKALPLRSAVTLAERLRSAGY